MMNGSNPIQRALKLQIHLDTFVCVCVYIYIGWNIYRIVMNMIKPYSMVFTRDSSCLMWRQLKNLHT